MLNVEHKDIFGKDVDLNDTVASPDGALGVVVELITDSADGFIVIEHPGGSRICCEAHRCSIQQKAKSPSPSDDDADDDTEDSGEEEDTDSDPAAIDDVDVPVPSAKKRAKKSGRNK